MSFTLVIERSGPTVFIPSTGDPCKNDDFISKKYGTTLVVGKFMMVSPYDIQFPLWKASISFEKFQQPLQVMEHIGFTVTSYITQETVMVHHRLWVYHRRRFNTSKHRSMSNRMKMEGMTTCPRRYLGQPCRQRRTADAAAAAAAAATGTRRLPVRHRLHSGHRVGHHEIDGLLRRPADLATRATDPHADFSRRRRCGSVRLEAPPVALEKIGARSQGWPFVCLRTRDSSRWPVR